MSNYDDQVFPREVHHVSRGEAMSEHDKGVEWGRLRGNAGDVKRIAELEAEVTRLNGLDVTQAATIRCLEAENERLRTQLRRVTISIVPRSWLDPVLTGPATVIGKPPYTCDDVERLLNALRQRLANLLTEEPKGEETP